jgi:tetratricopeptide (TPR) repeat protein
MPFWPFVRSIRVEQLTPLELQARLVEAAYSRRSYLRRFCRVYREQIEANVAILVKGAPGFQADPVQVNRLVQGLATAAQCLANECGSPALWEKLVGTPDENPLLRWPRFLETIPERMQQLQHDALRVELAERINETQSLVGDAARQHEAIFNGRLGEVCFHSGRVDEAVAPMQRALALCREINDRAGIAIYLNNLFEIARYRGDIPETIRILQDLREEFTQQGRDKEAADAGRRLELVRKGEPLCRIVCRHGERTFELDELKPGREGRYQFEYVRSRPQLHMAVTLTQQGNEKASAGSLADALELYHRAMDIDPHDPDPRSQAGMALLELGAYAKGREMFVEVERLAPGWFHCRSDRWLAEQLESGELPAEVLTILRALEDGGSPPAERMKCAGPGVDRFPDFAPFWLVLGDCLRDQDNSTEAEKAYRRGLACAQEPDTESIARSRDFYRQTHRNGSVLSTRRSD